ncbi:MAG: cytochrome c [Vicinamibacterales bacterium]
MKKVISAAALGVSAAALVGSGLYFAPPVAAQQQQAAAPNPQAGLPWAYGFPTSATAAPGGGARGGGPAAPAAPAAAPEPEHNLDEVHHVPGASRGLTLREIEDNRNPGDWFPDDHPKMPDIVARGGGPGANACGYCHYPNGKGRPNNAGPAGLPASYILQQLQDFISGARTSFDKRKRNTGQMIAIAKAMKPSEMKAAAEYFASMKWTPYVRVVEAATVPKAEFVGGGGSLVVPLTGAEAGTEPLGNRIIETPENVEQTEPLRNPRSGFIAYVPPGSLKKGEEVVLFGANGRTVTCAACHGEGLKGTDTVPSLAGRSPSYLARQMMDFKHYTRVGPGAMQMQPIVQHMTEDDILNAVAYIASLEP